MMPHKKQTLLVDFDGVIHDYQGWNDGQLGEPVAGAEEWLWSMQRLYEVVIVSPRFGVDDGIPEIRVLQWLIDSFGYLVEHLSIWGLRSLPPHHLYVSARCLPFAGTFPSTQEVCGFRPYWRKRSVEEVEIPEDVYDEVDAGVYI